VPRSAPLGKAVLEPAHPETAGAQRRHRLVGENAIGTAAARDDLLGAIELGGDWIGRKAGGLPKRLIDVVDAEGWVLCFPDLAPRSVSPYCRGTDLVVPCMKACISSGVRRPSLLLSIALKMRS
jgi:hypothetical protein